jgi:hypothetical protein
MLRLLQGNVLGALAANPLAACGAVAFVAGGLLAPVWVACGGPAPSLAVRPSRRWLAAFAGVFFANWAWLAAAGV